MPSPQKFLFTRFAPETGGLHSGAKQYQIVEYPAGADVPFGAVKAPSWASVTAGWQDGDGPTPPPPPPAPDAPEQENK